MFHMFSYDKTSLFNKRNSHIRTYIYILFTNIAHTVTVIHQKPTINI